MKDNPLAGFPYGAAYPPMDPAQLGMWADSASGPLTMHEWIAWQYSLSTAGIPPTLASTKLSRAQAYAQEVRQRKGMVVKRIQP